MLEVAREYARTEGVSELVDLRLGDMRDPPVPERVRLVLIPFRSMLHMTTDADRLRAFGAARELLLPGGRLVFDVFAPGRDDVEDTHGRWLEREPGIFERADWDEGERTLTLSVRRGEEASTMHLAWLSPPEWRLLLDHAGFEVEAQWGWFDRRPYAGGEDVVFAAVRDRA
jgi:SAM-dependent methyltransferase